MKHTIIALAILLTGCVSVPVERNFPDAPPEIKQNCPKLEAVPTDTTRLSEVLVVVTNNYALYHECALKVETWNDWYKSQKKIFEQ